MCHCACLVGKETADLLAGVCGMLRGGDGDQPAAADGGAAPARAGVPVLLLLSGEAVASWHFMHREAVNSSLLRLQQAGVSRHCKTAAALP